MGYQVGDQVERVPDPGFEAPLSPLMGPLPGHKHLGQNPEDAQLPGGPESGQVRLHYKPFPGLGNPYAAAVGTCAEVGTATIPDMLLLPRKYFENKSCLMMLCEKTSFWVWGPPWVYGSTKPFHQIHVFLCSKLWQKAGHCTGGNSGKSSLIDRCLRRR